VTASTRVCSRCDWTADTESGDAPRLQAVAHATDAGHPLCTVCLRSLTVLEPVVCERCLMRCQRQLAQLVEQYALLPDELTHTTAQSALVLLGPGSDGSAFRDLSKAEWKALAGAHQHRLHLPGREHGVDNREGDGVSVVHVLSSWVTDWREHHGEGGPDKHPTVVGSAGYLERRMRASSNGDAEREPHPAFADFALELGKLLEDVEAAGHRDNRPARAPVTCFDCGRLGTLRRTYRSPDRCDHRRPTFPPSRRPALDDAGRPVLDDRGRPRQVRVPPEELRAQHEADLRRWASEHSRCDQGGLAPRWTCRACDREYDDEEYMLALAQSMTDISSHTGWGQVWEVATSLGVPVRTVRAWVDRMRVTSACSVETQRVMVWWPDARDRAVARQPRSQGTA
jgi:hypothetical protein